MTAVVPIRKRTWDVDPSKPESIKKLASDIGEMARDLAQFLGQLPPLKVLEFTAQYAEPMYVAFDHNPQAVVLMRLRYASSPETPVLSGGMVHGAWDGSRFRVDSIDGMSPGTGLNYIFTFLMVG